MPRELRITAPSAEHAAHRTPGVHRPAHPPPPRSTLVVDGEDGERARNVAKALTSEPRWRLLRALGEQLRNVGELAEALAMPPSTVAMHLDVLEAAGLVRSEYAPAGAAASGCASACSTRCASTCRAAPPPASAPSSRRACRWAPTPTPRSRPPAASPAPTRSSGCSTTPRPSTSPTTSARNWCGSARGRLAYRFPNRLPPRARADTLWFSAELCSEAPMHHHDWPSDVTVWVNGVRLGHWTSPADFGGQRGLLTPAWWDARNTQYGCSRSGASPRTAATSTACASPT
jgi:hypothetical protein